MSESLQVLSCPSCKHNFKGRFCPNCGEKITNKNYSFKEFLSNVLEGFYNFDTKFFKSLKLLIVKPGFLTSEFLQGRRVNYLKPFQLFLIINIVMVFFSSLFLAENLLVSSYRTHTNMMFYSNFAVNLTEHAHIERGVEKEEYVKQFNNRLNNYSQTLIFILIPLFAIFMKMLFLDRYYFEHLIYSTHLLAYFLFFFGFMVTPFVLVLDLLYQNLFNSHIGNVDGFVGPLFLIVMGSYFVFSVKRVYRNNWLFTIVKSFILLILLVMNIFLYKFILFLIVAFSLKVW